ncbi:MAG: hypothetical protein ACI93R_002652 [Flavobacteriales bacterium]|jgi:hypothetical protein
MAPEQSPSYTWALIISSQSSVLLYPTINFVNEGEFQILGRTLQLFTLYVIRYTLYVIRYTLYVILMYWLKIVRHQLRLSSAPALLNR